MTSTTQYAGNLAWLNDLAVEERDSRLSVSLTDSHPLYEKLLRRVITAQSEGDSITLVLKLANGNTADLSGTFAGSGKGAARQSRVIAIQPAGFEKAIAPRVDVTAVKMIVAKVPKKLAYTIWDSETASPRNITPISKPAATAPSMALAMRKGA